jgi:murein DD-endopeptidase MepM/ murein hydrolase activator NlpD
MSEEYLLKNPQAEDREITEPDRWERIWTSISRAGLADVAVRLGTHILLIAVILVVAWGMREFYSQAQVFDITNLKTTSNTDVLAAPLPSPTPRDSRPSLPIFQPQDSIDEDVSRQASLHTDVPSRPRTDVQIYTVQAGDTLFGIAEKFGLKPETILWGNQFVLGDNPHNIRPGQELNILPIDGTYHRWSEGDGLNGVANFFDVAPEDIIEYPGNNLSIESIGDWTRPNIASGTWIIIPGGSRAFVSWSAPEIPRDNPGVAKVLGPGACDSISDGAIGSGAFVWPSNSHLVNGFDFNPSANHSGIDIDGEEGDPVYAADNGVIVYAGWNNWGYGNAIVVNHGNGWQTLYAHLSALYVGCGQSVYQGNSIGAIGTTGNSTGSHLHFEMMHDGTKVDPKNYLP